LDEEKLAKLAAEKILEALDADLDEACATLTGGTPPEIAKIDNANTADEKFRAKIAWIQSTANELVEKADSLNTVAEELKVYKDAEEKRIKEERDNTRIEEVKALELFSEEDFEKITANFVDLEDEAYQLWLEEKKAIAAAVSLRLDGGAGSVEEEAGSGETKIKSAPRADRKVNVSVAEELENAEVEKHLESEEEVDDTPNAFVALATSLVNRGKKIKKTEE